jgi:peptidoglycan/xylan/chitin deacetylase (PgdA/CDA1 family)
MLGPALLSLASPGGAQGKLSTLIFHRVLDKPDELFPEEIDALQFNAVCSWLREWFTVLPLVNAVERLFRRELPPRSLAVTFDDGYADNESIAAPILARHGLTATFFVASDFLDGGCMWNDGVIHAVRRCGLGTLDVRGLVEGVDRFDLHDAISRRVAVDVLIKHLKYLEPSARQAAVRALAERAQVTLPTDLMMTSTQLRALRKRGFDIGAHTASHPILAKLTAAKAQWNIETGRDRLQTILGERVALFAYPNGKPNIDFTADSVRLVRDAGFDAAVSTAWGVSTSASDRFQLPRFTPWDRHKLRFGGRLAANCFVTPQSLATTGGVRAS